MPRHTQGYHDDTHVSGYNLLTCTTRVYKYSGTQYVVLIVLGVSRTPREVVVIINITYSYQVFLLYEEGVQ